MKSPAKGAATTIHLASAPGLVTVTGSYFVNSKPKRSAKHSYDEAVAARLWWASADFVGLTSRDASNLGDEDTPSDRARARRSAGGPAPD